MDYFYYASVELLCPFQVPIYFHFTEKNSMNILLNFYLCVSLKKEHQIALGEQKMAEVLIKY